VDEKLFLFSYFIRVKEKKMKKQRGFMDLKLSILIAVLALIFLIILV
jgi:hypothetical protein